MILAIDFDGTLHTGRWPGIGAPAPYAKEVMQRLKDEGHYLIIWTCRERERQTEMVNWLLEKGIPFDRINEHKPGSVEQYGYASRKVYAHLYIDDKQVGGLPTWSEIYEFVRQKENEYQQLKNQ
jgi:hydroxymethylpyrimidine pyrophosphatase-like HAD family hydrolase